MNPVVPKRETPLTGLELARALREGHVLTHGVTPTDARLACAWAHVAHETGQGRLMSNLNFGHVMAGSTWAGPIYYWGTTPEHGRDGVWRPTPVYFRSYDDPARAAADYWGVLDRHYAPARDLFDANDPHEAALELGRLGWYTAAREAYALDMELLAQHAGEVVLPALHELVDPNPTVGRFWALGDAVRLGKESA